MTTSTSPGTGRRQWRSLLEADGDPAFLARVAAEFPGLRQALAAPLERRRVLQLMGASLALAGLAGCDDPAGEDGHYIPAVIAPPDIVPGIPDHYTTASLGSGSPIGVIVTHQMGRPIKVEGNPAHPASLGATDIFAQAMLLDFYDPDRSTSLTAAGIPSSRPALLAALAQAHTGWVADRGAGLRVLTGDVVSPTLAAQLDAFRAAYPEARVHGWDTLARTADRRAAVLAYGTPVGVVPRPAAARVIVGFESDLLDGAPGHIAHARAVVSRRNPTRTDGSASLGQMSRLYAIEPRPTLFGTMADHRIVADPARAAALLVAICRGVLGGEAPADQAAAAIVADLDAHRGNALLHGGPHLSPEALALLHAANEALGGRGVTFDVLAPAVGPDAGTLAELVLDMHAGRAHSVVVFGTNPAFTAPHSGFAEALVTMGFSLVLAETPDETAAAAHWFVPATHPFETWSDARAFDGTATIMQPQALPLYDGISPHTLLALLTDGRAPPPRDLVRAAWQLDEPAMRDALASGVLPGTASARSEAPLRADAARLSPPMPAAGLTVLCRPDPNLLDGRHANNAWLQELPRPLTKLVWDNPLLLPPAMMRRLGLANGHVIRLDIGDTYVEAPVFGHAGLAPDTVLALTGYGRRMVGSVGAGTGVDLFSLAGVGGAVRIVPTGKRLALASTDHHDVLAADASGAARDIVRQVSLSQVLAGLRAAPAQGYDPSLYPERAMAPTKWGMSIDLNSCIGCNACVVACQAENNIPTVGKEQVLVEREMHWLRIDRYYEGAPDAPDAAFMPVLCMQCETAPCEVVCPVGATVHDSEGINAMVYNRCVGTRFCSNNCPYKVRRFNFGAYAQEERRPAVSRNPDVSVRARGVMEKCTFCIQRIAQGRIAADLGDRRIADGEVVTACQGACPTRAITFGDIADAGSEVAKRKRSPLDYALLAEYSTRPRVTYEARVRNRNPALPA